MPIVIETYTQPYSIIAAKLFTEESFTYLDKPITESNEKTFYYTRRELDCERICYYFSKIYYIEANKIVAIDKTAQRIKYYDLETGKLIRFETQEPQQQSNPDLSSLPHMYAQSGDIVVFPENEEDDD